MGKSGNIDIQLMETMKWQNETENQLDTVFKDKHGIN